MRLCDHDPDGGEPLMSWAQFEAVPWCPRCGLVERLTSGPMALDEFPEVLLCAGCMRPLVAL